MTNTESVFFPVRQVSGGEMAANSSRYSSLGTLTGLKSVSSLSEDFDLISYSSEDKNGIREHLKTSWAAQSSWRNSADSIGCSVWRRRDSAKSCPALNKLGKTSEEFGPSTGRKLWCSLPAITVCCESEVDVCSVDQVLLPKIVEFTCSDSVLNSDNELMCKETNVDLASKRVEKLHGCDVEEFSRRGDQIAIGSQCRRYSGHCSHAEESSQDGNNTPHQSPTSATSEHFNIEDRAEKLDVGDLETPTDNLEEQFINELEFSTILTLAYVRARDLTNNIDKALDFLVSLDDNEEHDQVEDLRLRIKNAFASRANLALEHAKWKSQFSHNHQLREKHKEVLSVRAERAQQTSQELRKRFDELREEPSSIKPRRPWFRRIFSCGSSE